MEQDLEEASASVAEEEVCEKTNVESETVSTSDIIALTSQIVASYVKGHTVPMDKISTLVRVVFSALNHLRQTVQSSPDSENQQTQAPIPLIMQTDALSFYPKLNTPAVPIQGSVTDDYIICLEDGKKFKMLKRYLRTRYNMTPEQYRQKWHLPRAYPMVARNYSRKRSLLARRNRLGKIQHKEEENS